VFRCGGSFVGLDDVDRLIRPGADLGGELGGQLFLDRVVLCLQGQIVCAPPRWVVAALARGDVLTSSLQGLILCAPPRWVVAALARGDVLASSLQGLIVCAPPRWVVAGLASSLHGRIDHWWILVEVGPDHPVSSGPSGPVK
jgi:hypothetical protein